MPIQNTTSTEPLAPFDLSREIADSVAKKPWASGLYTRTLVKYQDFRLVLIALESGALMKEHHVDGTISVQVLEGRIRFGVGERYEEMAAGQLAVLGPSVRHSLEALEPSAVLLTISWPPTRELRDMSHRGY
jgi:quercetin dioxygenase-like cupin family protein